LTGPFNYLATVECLLSARKILPFSLGLVLASNSLVSCAVFRGPKRALPVLVSIESWFLGVLFFGSDQAVLKSKGKFYKKKKKRK
jgi:hypothetical protein